MRHQVLPRRSDVAHHEGRAGSTEAQFLAQLQQFQGEGTKKCERNKNQFSFNFQLPPPPFISCPQAFSVVVSLLLLPPPPSSFCLEQEEEEGGRNQVSYFLFFLLLLLLLHHLASKASKQAVQCRPAQLPQADAHVSVYILYIYYIPGYLHAQHQNHLQGRLAPTSPVRPGRQEGGRKEACACIGLPVRPPASHVGREKAKPPLLPAATYSCQREEKKMAHSMKSVGRGLYVPTYIHTREIKQPMDRKEAPLLFSFFSARRNKIRQGYIPNSPVWCSQLWEHGRKGKGRGGRQRQSLHGKKTRLRFVRQ